MSNSSLLFLLLRDASSRDKPILLCTKGYLPDGRPQMWLAPKANFHQEVTELYARSHRAPHAQHAIAAPQPSKNHALVGNGHPTVGHTDT